MRAVIANEPAIYREVISAALKELRPDIEIFTSEPRGCYEPVRRMPAACWTKRQANATK
jgi:hypothetical protein